MKDKEIELMFNELQGHFDYEEPGNGHLNRFLDKLEKEKSPRRIEWYSWRIMAPMVSVAAALILFFGLNFMTTTEPGMQDLADVSPEMAQTQSFFVNAINTELSKIQGQRSTDTQILIDDAMEQMAILENEYKQLQEDLRESGDDQRVIFAMISNFQNRVDLLRNVLEHINQINNLKNSLNENSNTI
ncbi:MAG: hypothetical protein R3213_01265 [Flavobacteriaceae bacterium]|nr:hypothetical protein [Flavobacteriaceae bacterium]